MSDDELLFEGLKVLDVASWIAAPVAATILGDLGADVIKVEVPGDGDPYRRLAMAPGTPASDVNYTWLMDQRGKRSITLNLKTEQGRAILKRLVRDCDVYITNQPLSMRRELSLGYEDLEPLNPRMIFASFTAYGEKGPERDREGFDGIAYWARSGLMDLVRAPGSPPGASVAGQGDHPSGVSLYAAIVTALLRRERTGKGTMVHTSLLANGYWGNGCMGQAALVGADFSPRHEARMRPPNPIRTLYECSDGRHLQLFMVRTQDQVNAILRIIGREDLVEDPRFGSREARAEHPGELTDILREGFAKRPLRAWLDALHGADVPASHVAIVEDMLDDEQAKINEVLVEPTDADVNAPFVINNPVFVEGIGRVQPRKAPEVGEHTDAILTKLGYAPEEIAELRAQGVV
ncbi:MAG: CoA transferase [Gammaproteobacteria bacterium]|jgi:crotonobetainyl-CoA:carnitine CoA-transferase CaiB-like acyl-CoA transferase